MDHSLGYEGGLVVGEGVEAALDDVVGVLILNQSHHILIFELGDQEVALIGLSKLEGLLDDAAAVFGFCERKHVTQYLVENSFALIVAAVLDQLLYDIVAEDVIDELVEAFYRFLKYEVLK